MYKQKTRFYSVLLLILCNIILISCSNDDELQTDSLTPQDLYQTSWKGRGHCDAWAYPDMAVGMQFISTEKGKVIWENYNPIDVTYTIEGKYITFNSTAQYLAGSPWLIKSYTKNHITLIQNEASPDKEKIAVIELDKIE
ncbi:hypothetical protein [uncultured Phocaeicola sp.]|uniref:hypothetical protein n=1 Tax=uncultured Phocaeicola sp. TaxID=990718 RepID=UPI002599FDCB|nr:hypothetical protein [uncultured Phocaeicola sp.]